MLSNASSCGQPIGRSRNFKSAIIPPMFNLDKKEIIGVRPLVSRLFSCSLWNKAQGKILDFVHFIKCLKQRP